MTKDELHRLIKTGKVPITIDCRVVYNGIFRMLRVTDDNIVFLDFDDEFISAEGLRFTFRYLSFDKMICSIESFLGVSIENLNQIFEINSCNSLQKDWNNLKWDLYNNKINLLSGYHTYYIGDLYWRGIYSRNISPESTDQELREYILSNI